MSLSCTKDEWNAYMRAWKRAHPEATTRHRRESVQRHSARHNSKQAARRAAKKCATPMWSEQDAIRAVYEKAKHWNMEVDHVVPVRNPLVCGLHVHANLQLMAKSDNSAKGNRSWLDMP